jgi:PAB-dependent poly(A)-specific ribonuclease subunit 2
MLVQRDNLLSLSPNSFNIHSKGGIPSYSFTREDFHDQLLVFTSTGSSSSKSSLSQQRIVLGGNLNSLFSVDVRTDDIVDRVTTTQGVCVLKTGSRYVVSGGIMGELSLRDPRTLKAEHNFEVHTGSISDIEIKNDLLVTCGFANRYGELYVDPVIKTFDVRTMRLLGQVHFPYGPAMMKFHPMFSSLLCIVSQSGYFQFRDIQSDLSMGGTLSRGVSDTTVYTIDSSGEGIECFDMSASGEVLMFGDSAGTVHVYSLKALQADDQNLSRLNKNPVNRNEDPNQSDGLDLLSNWPSEPSLIGQHPPEIHPQIMANLKSVTNPYSHSKYGIAFNPGLKRPQDGYLERKTFMNFMTPNQRKDAKRYKELNVIPRDYDYIEVNPSIKHRGFKEFDSSKYNKTQYVGLENQVEHTCYCNAFIQLIYHLHTDLRVAIMNHTCDNPLCLACELSFLFYTFQQIENSPQEVNRNITPGNFLRTLRRMYIEKILPEEQLLDPSTNLSSGEKAILFNKIIWEQLHKELRSDVYPYPISYPFTVTLPSKHPAMNTTISTNNSNIQLLRKSSIHTPSKSSQTKDIIDIMLGAQVANNSDSSNTTAINQSPKMFTHPLKLSNSTTNITFADLVTSALNWDTTTDPTSYKTLANLPNILNLTFSLDQEDIKWLRSQHLKRFSLESGALDEQQGFKLNSKASIPPKFTVRYNEGHMNWRVEDVNYDLSSTSSATNFNTATASPQKHGRKPQAAKKQTAEDGRSITYSLRAVIIEVKHPFEQNPDEKRDHCVAFVRIPNERQELEWHLFNDFSITRHEAAFDYSQSWKTPCVLFYARDDIDKVVMPKPLEFKNPIKIERVFRNDFMPVDPNKIPKQNPELRIPQKGELVSLDAEFVILEMDKRKNEKKVQKEVDSAAEVLESTGIIPVFGDHQPIFSLGRVSVLLDDQNFDTLVDDFIATRSEVVHDYMTRYSGLKHGDMDAETSEHNVTHLKATFMKLRALVDRGVIFVGHGLQNDFKIINIFVPKSQIIDTVELFQLPRQRKISLRFLSNFLLHSDIQQETHCSVEDARAALQIYHKYLEAAKKGEFEQLLTDIYTVGRHCNWQIESALALKNSLTVYEETIKK